MRINKHIYKQANIYIVYIQMHKYIFISIYINVCINVYAQMYVCI
jgi:hypothetical protein